MSSEAPCGYCGLHPSTSGPGGPCALCARAISAGRAPHRPHHDAVPCRVCGMWAASQAGMCTTCSRDWHTGKLREKSLQFVPDCRPRMPCVRCKGTSHIRCFVQERAAQGGHYAFSFTAPLAVIGDPTGQRGGSGLLQAYICQSCGFVEWYVANPGEIPIGPQHLTEVVESTGKGPYR